MKTHIIQLLINDDVVSVQDRMNWNHTGRILLVWPPQGVPLNRKLDLILVKRHAEQIGTQLAAVAADPEIRFNARQAGIPMFASLHQAQYAQWPELGQAQLDSHANKPHRSQSALRRLIPSPSRDWGGYPWVRILTVLASLLAMISLGIYLLPGATIILTPQEEMQSAALPLSTDPDQETVHLADQILPTYSQEVIVEGTDSQAATGSMVLPNQVATGSLKVSNISNHKVILPIGSIITSGDNGSIRFITTTVSEMMLAPGTSANISVQAMKPGTAGNLPANSLLAIEGQVGLDVTVTNPEAMHGGEDAPAPSPTQADLDSLTERLRARLMQDAQAALQGRVPSKDVLIPGGLKIVEVLVETPNPAVGEPGRQLDLTLRLRFQSRIIVWEALNDLVSPILDAKLADGYQPIPGSLVIASITRTSGSATGGTRWNLQVQRKIQPEFSAGDLRIRIKGSTVSQAMDSINHAIPLALPAQIQLHPSWWPMLPLLPMRINVIMVEAQ